MAEEEARYRPEAFGYLLEGQTAWIEIPPGARCWTEQQGEDLKVCHEWDTPDGRTLTKKILVEAIMVESIIEAGPDGWPENDG